METKETRDKRVIIPLSQAEVEAIDDWRFANRMPSRAAAIREMLRRLIESDAYVKSMGMEPLKR